MPCPGANTCSRLLLSLSPSPPLRPRPLDPPLWLRCRLDVKCSSNLSTHDLETEIFLHVLAHCAEYVQGDGDPDPSQAAAMATMAEGDGMGR